MSRFAPLLLLVAPLVAQEPEGTQTWAVVIGVSEYDNDAVPDLTWADRDARTFAEFLIARGGVHRNRIWLLTSPERGPKGESQLVADILHISRQAVDKRRKAGNLLGLVVGHRGYEYTACLRSRRSVTDDRTSSSGSPAATENTGAPNPTTGIYRIRVVRTGQTSGRSQAMLL